MSRSSAGGGRMDARLLKRFETRGDGPVLSEATLTGLERLRAEETDLRRLWPPGVSLSPDLSPFASSLSRLKFRAPSISAPNATGDRLSTPALLPTAGDVGPDWTMPPELASSGERGRSKESLLGVSVSRSKLYMDDLRERGDIAESLPLAVVL